jgi:pSer/pThr/pTyr-binding forkhead associated (FHA) protein
MTVIGRREDCDLRIPLGEISRKHCRIIMDGQTLRVEDLGSSNGTYVNGQRVQEATVAPGDTIQVGSLAFVVQIDGAPADEELQPVRSTAVPNSQGSGGPLDDSGAGEAAVAAATSAEPADGDDFDPMAILEAGDSAPGMIPDPEDSGAMIMPDDSTAAQTPQDSGADDAAMDLDLEEPKHS